MPVIAQVVSTAQSTSTTSSAEHTAANQGSSFEEVLANTNSGSNTTDTSGSDNAGNAQNSTNIGSTNNKNNGVSQSSSDSGQSSQVSTITATGSQDIQNINVMIDNLINILSGIKNNLSESDKKNIAEIKNTIIQLHSQGLSLPQIANIIAKAMAEMVQKKNNQNSSVNDTNSSADDVALEKTEKTSKNITLEISGNASSSTSMDSIISSIAQGLLVNVNSTNEQNSPRPVSEKKNIENVPQNSVEQLSEGSISQSLSTLDVQKVGFSSSSKSTNLSENSASPNASTFLSTTAVSSTVSTAQNHDSSSMHLVANSISSPTIATAQNSTLLLRTLTRAITSGNQSVSQISISELLGLLKENIAKITTKNDTQGSQGNTSFNASLIGATGAMSLSNVGLSSSKFVQTSLAGDDVNGMIEQIVQAVSVKNVNTNPVIRIVLNPPHLGELTVKMTVGPNQNVSATMSTGSEAVRATLLANTGQLMRSFSDVGVKLIGLTVDLSGQRQSQDSRQQQDQAVEMKKVKQPSNETSKTTNDSSVNSPILQGSNLQLLNQLV